MNITGLLFLKDQGLTIMRHTFFFRNLSEIPKAHKEIFKDEKKWAMGIGDDRTSIKDNPYKSNVIRKYDVKASLFEEAFHDLNKKAEEKVPIKNRIFFVCEQSSSNQVLFSGHAVKQGNVIKIDLKHGNRPQNRDWTPDMHFSCNIFGRRVMLDTSIPQEFREYIFSLCNDIVKLPEGCLDFTCRNDGYFFYHDFIEI